MLHVRTTGTCVLQECSVVFHSYFSFLVATMQFLYWKQEVQLSAFYAFGLIGWMDKQTNKKKQVLKIYAFGGSSCLCVGRYLYLSITRRRAAAAGYSLHKYTTTDKIPIRSTHRIPKWKFHKAITEQQSNRNSAALHQGGPADHLSVWMHASLMCLPAYLNIHMFTSYWTGTLSKISKISIEYRYLYCASNK